MEVRHIILLSCNLNVRYVTFKCLSLWTFNTSILQCSINRRLMLNKKKNLLFAQFYFSFWFFSEKYLVSDSLCLTGQIDFRVLGLIWISWPGASWATGAGCCGRDQWGGCRGRGPGQGSPQPSRGRPAPWWGPGWCWTWSLSAEYWTHRASEHLQPPNITPNIEREKGFYEGPPLTIIMRF